MNRKDVLKAVRAKVSEGNFEDDIVFCLAKRLLLSHVIPDAARSEKGCAYAYANLHSREYTPQIERLLMDARPIGGVRALRDKQWRDNMPPDTATFHSRDNQAKELLHKRHIIKAVRYSAMCRFCAALYSIYMPPHLTTGHVGFFLTGDEIRRCLSMPDWCTPILNMLVGGAYVDGTGMVALRFSEERLKLAVESCFPTAGECAIALAALESYQLTEHRVVKTVCENLPWFV